LSDLTTQKTRNIFLPGAEPYSSLTSLESRLLKFGFTTSNAVTLKEIRSCFLDPTELSRCVHRATLANRHDTFLILRISISALEFLDETEELELVLDHYAITYGLKVSPTPSPTSDLRMKDVELDVMIQSPSQEQEHWMKWGLTRR